MVTTWNTADYNAAKFTISAGSLAYAASTNTGNGLGRATVSKSAGKWYWEMTINNNLGTWQGIALSNPGSTTLLGADANGYSYYGANGSYFNGNAYHNFSAGSYGNADVIGMALDCDGGSLVAYKNGTRQGAILIAAGSTWFPAFGWANDALLNNGATANFGATTFTQTPPAGFVGFDSSPVAVSSSIYFGGGF